MHHENVVASLHIEILPMGAPTSTSYVQIVESGSEWKAYLVQELMDCSLNTWVERGAFDSISSELKKRAIACILKDVASGMTITFYTTITPGSQ